MFSTGSPCSGTTSCIGFFLSFFFSERSRRGALEGLCSSLPFSEALLSFLFIVLFFFLVVVVLCCDSGSESAIAKVFASCARGLGVQLTQPG